MRHWHVPLVQGTDPAHWLPGTLLYLEKRELCAVLASEATWGDLQQAFAYAQTRQQQAFAYAQTRQQQAFAYAQTRQQRAFAYAQTRQQRASGRGHLRAYRDHTVRAAQLRVVLDTFAPLMAAHPARTFGEACQVIRLGPGHDPRKVGKEL